MKGKTVAAEETPERAAESIAAALDFLLGEAEAADLAEVGDLIRLASARARERAAPSSSNRSIGHETSC